MPVCPWIPCQTLIPDVGGKENFDRSLPQPQTFLDTLDCSLSTRNFLSLFFFPSKFVCWVFSHYTAPLLHPSWQDAHGVSPGTPPSHGILPSAAAIALPAQSLRLLIPQTKLTYAYTFPRWIPTLLSLPTNWQVPSFMFPTSFINSQNSAYWHLSHCKIYRWAEDLFSLFNSVRRKINKSVPPSFPNPGKGWVPSWAVYCSSPQDHIPTALLLLVPPFQCCWTKSRQWNILVSRCSTSLNVDVFKYLYREYDTISLRWSLWEFQEKGCLISS